MHFFQLVKSARLWGVWVMSALVLGWLFYTDPDSGGSTRDMLQNVAAGGLAITFAYLGRKSLLNYIKLEHFARAGLQGNIGAAIVFLGVMIFMSALVLLFGSRAHAQDVQTYVPAGAYQYAPVLKAEQAHLWPAHPLPSALGALVEQESCISLKHARCWNPAARLKRVDEEGAGFGQMTRAYREDGSLRFDALAETRRLDPSLSELSWDNIYQRPDLQLRAMVLMNRDCYRRIGRLVTEEQSRLAMCDAAYNGGWAGMQQERRACGQRAGCDPQKWFKNVEQVCLKSNKPLRKFSRSACEINREHVRMVIVTRRPKYIPLLETT